MPTHKKNHITTERKLATETDLPEPQNFHQHLRELIRGATRVVMEEIMQEELTLFLQAQWGEITPTRKGYRNGFYTRDLLTSTGQLLLLRAFFTTRL